MERLSDGSDPSICIFVYFNCTEMDCLEIIGIILISYSIGELMSQ